MLGPCGDGFSSSAADGHSARGDAVVGIARSAAPQLQDGDPRDDCVRMQMDGGTRHGHWARGLEGEECAGCGVSLGSLHQPV